MVDSLDRTQFNPVFLSTQRGPLSTEMLARDVELIDVDAGSIGRNDVLGSISKIWRIRNLLTARGVDIVHINEYGWNLDLAYAARVAGCKLVLHFHNPGGVNWTNLHWLLANIVLLVSKGQQDTIEGFHRVADKSMIMYNSVDLEKFSADKLPRSELGLAEDDIVIVTVAQIGYRKGIDILLDAAEIVLRAEPRAKFLIIGPDAQKESAYANLQRDRVKQSVMSSRVEFLGSRTDVNRILPAMDIFCLPTRAEPFGMVFIEAMASGLPVVATRVGGVPEIIRNDAEGILVSSERPEELAAELIGLIKNPERRQSIGDVGKGSLRGRFDRATLSEKLSSMYRQLMSDGRKPRSD
jgi:glycosyltransferase involved in cell wall biosynthesis